MFWREEMATGVREIDDRIKQFVDDVNAGIRKMNTTRNPALMVKQIDEIKNACIDYFSYQETMMTISNYPQYYQHRHDHEILIDRIGVVTNEYMAGSYGYSTSQLENTINEWFIRHVFMSDKQFAEFYKKRKNL
jgi:hemerythrin-like metal-binding protein